jgi:hypothetical protein
MINFEMMINDGRLFSWLSRKSKIKCKIIYLCETMNHGRDGSITQKSNLKTVKWYVESEKNISYKSSNNLNRKTHVT